MEDVVSKRCSFVDANGERCDKHPSYGHAGELRTVRFFGELPQKRSLESYLRNEENECVRL